MTKQEMVEFRRRRRKILRLWRGGKGMPQADIGRKLGLKRQRVHQIIRGN